MFKEPTVRMLVTAASRHGATREIARAIGETLSRSGIEVDVVDPEDQRGIGQYDGFVVGSAVYMGRWLEEARSFAHDHAQMLRSRPTWLFSSGPIGDPPRPDEDPVDVAEIVEAVAVREHRVFPGKLDRSSLTFGEKAVAIALKAPEGDFRPWEAIREWAVHIAGEMQAGDG